MRLVDYLDKGASLDPEAPCFTTDGETRTYREVQRLSVRVAAALAARGIAPGERVAVLSGNDPTAFTCVFGISRAGAVWCPINPRNEAYENRELLDLFGCTALIYQASFSRWSPRSAMGCRRCGRWSVWRQNSTTSSWTALLISRPWMTWR